MEIADKVIAIILRETGKDALGTQSPIEDLDLDSLEFVELLGTFEQELGVTLSDEEAGQAKTVGDLVMYVTKQTAQC